MGTYKMFMCFSRDFDPSNSGSPPDVEAAFLRFSDGGPHMTHDQLLCFLVEFQGEEERTVEEAERIVETVCGGTGGVMSVGDFLRFLFSDEFNPPIRMEVYHDMTAPLSHYYIFSGHNSYLIGNQLNSDCSVDPIIEALQRGVRVIELDMWPNSEKDDVNILHGWTMTSPVDLMSCLAAIKEHAFSASPYPVILTLEDHLTPDLQAKVAEMLLQTFGETLYYPDSESLEEFPSPEILKYRILISTKPPKEYLAAKSMKHNGKSIFSKRKDPVDDEPGEEDDPYADTKLYSDYEDNSDDENEYNDEETLCHNVLVEYKNLIAMKETKPKKLEEALDIDPYQVGLLNLSEPTLEKAASSYGPSIVRFSQKNTIRVYPKGTRFNSSNYNPLIGWMHGAQMVAFNMQGYGKFLALMEGFFRANGGCGYVKKPEILLETGPNDVVFSPKSAHPVKQILKVKVYMSDGWNLDFDKKHFDNFSPPDFYTRIGIIGLPADCIMKKTKTIKDEWTPMWDEEFEFPLTVPELAFLRIEVLDNNLVAKDDFGGWMFLPLSELRPGIRAVPLYDKKGRKYNSVKLLMCFEFSDC